MEGITTLVEYEDLTDDPRLGKQATNRLGEEGTITRIARLADGYEIIEMDLGEGLQFAGGSDEVTV